MSFAADFSMYYSSTYVGLRRGDIVHPFYVEGIHYTSEYLSNQPDGFDDEDDDFEGNQDALYQDLEVGMEAIEFHGTIIEENGSRTTVTICGSDPSLVLEIPELGYAKNHREIWTWYQLCPAHSVKKGLNPRRVMPNQSMGLSRTTIFNIFNPHKRGGELVTPDLVKMDTALLYKGMMIARRDNNGTFQLNSCFSSKLSWLQQLIEEDVCLA